MILKFFNETRIEYYSQFYHQIECKCIPFDLLQFDESAEKTEEPQTNENKKPGIKVKFQSQDLTTSITLVLVTLFVYGMLHQFYGAVETCFKNPY